MSPEKNEFFRTECIKASKFMKNKSVVGSLRLGSIERSKVYSKASLSNKNSPIPPPHFLARVKRSPNSLMALTCSSKNSPSMKSVSCLSPCRSAIACKSRRAWFTSLSSLRARANMSITEPNSEICQKYKMPVPFLKCWSIHVFIPKALSSNFTCLPLHQCVVGLHNVKIKFHRHVTVTMIHNNFIYKLYQNAYIIIK